MMANADQAMMPVIYWAYWNRTLFSRLVVAVFGSSALWIGVGILYTRANPLGPQPMYLGAGGGVVAIQMTPADWLASTPFYVAAGICLALLVALPAASLYRRVRCAQLRHLLGTCSGEERRDALLPLRADRSGDVRRLVGPLVRLFNIEAEVVPAPAPAGTGMEPAAR